MIHPDVVGSVHFRPTGRRIATPEQSARIEAFLWGVVCGELIIGMKHFLKTGHH